jgi:small subunit ribosomal protein S6
MIQKRPDASKHLTGRKALREYETTFIVQPEISEEGNATLLTKLDGILTTGGAQRLMCEDHGKRKLAYEINKFHKGHYYTLMFLDEGQVVPDLERVLRLDESVLRFLTIQAEETVADVEGRIATATEAEVEQTKRAAERVAREVEEAAARRVAEETAQREAEEAAARAEAEGQQAAAEASEASDATDATDATDASDASDTPAEAAAEEAPAADAEASADDDSSESTSDEGEKS